ncbi:MAG: DUF4402 domain-containing protein [Sphingomonadales bacterium]|nr:DUF4402 domain-containing protein [Sphingomonadales bacterium]
MNNLTKFALIALPLLVATPALAASGGTSAQAGTAAAAVVAPIVLTHTAGTALSFGKFTAGTLGGTVVVSAAGAGSVTSDVAFVPGSAVTADSFTVTGDANRSVSVAATGSSVSNGAQVVTFTATPSASAVTLGATGTAAIKVGGTLTVPGNLATGTYSGTYSVTITYN